LPVEVLYYTDPACPWSWATEPKLRRLRWEFEGELAIRLVMGGLARRFDDAWAREQGLHGPRIGPAMALHWLEVAAHSGMPFEPLIWTTSPPTSSYPACMAVKAAAEQGEEAGLRYLRRVREGLMAERRRLDHPESLTAAAGEAGLDVARFRIDLDSPAIMEAFAADLERTRTVPDEARERGAVAKSGGHERLPLPSAEFGGPDGDRAAVYGPGPYEEYREAALACGAAPSRTDPLEPLAAVERLGRVATVEAEELSGRPAPVVRAELWAAAREWRLKPVMAQTGELWETA
jgi:predicted DsbA family dithiol-disulfide isomerase